MIILSSFLLITEDAGKCASSTPLMELIPCTDLTGCWAANDWWRSKDARFRSISGSLGSLAQPLTLSSILRWIHWKAPVHVQRSVPASVKSNPRPVSIYMAYRQVPPRRVCSKRSLAFDISTSRRPYPLGSKCLSADPAALAHLLTTYLHNCVLVAEPRCCASDLIRGPLTPSFRPFHQVPGGKRA